tara:strand:- start:2418 stop:3968 length:1551 start_codon:yes stop_codon:yes gene_type:complete
MLKRILGIVAAGLLLNKLFGRKNKDSGGAGGEQKSPTTIKEKYWEPLELEVIERNFKPGEKGRNEGSNNSPLTDQKRICATEGELIHFVKSHYNKQIRLIRSWVIEGTTIDIQKVFRDQKRLIYSNGYLQEFNKMVASWNNEIQTYKLRVKQAVEERHQAREAVRQFKIQNNLMAGREPQVHKKGFQVLKILIPFVLFFTEVSLNVIGLRAVIEGSEALITSIMLSLVNVGLSFSVGILILTHFLNPVGASKSKLFYAPFLFLYFIILFYINAVMGVFRAMTEKANIAANYQEAQDLANLALTEAVYPFDNLVDITFGGFFLMLVGFFFAFITLLDAYFFKDPIPGYGGLGERRAAAEKRVEKIKLEDTLLFTRTESNELAKLNSKHEERLYANESWKFYVDQLQKIVEHYEQFNTMTKEVLDSAMSLYREQNEKFRTTPPPSYFSEPIDNSFIKSFSSNYSHLTDEFKTDAEVSVIGKENYERIDKEYSDIQNKYIEFFNREKSELFKIVEEIDR